MAGTSLSPFHAFTKNGPSISLRIRSVLNRGSYILVSPARH
jgi:hypothetical protein